MCGARLDIQGDSSPGLPQRLRSRGSVRLRQVVDVAGPGLHNTQAVASLLGLRSNRQTRNILNQWSNRLSAEEHEMLKEYSSGAEVPNKGDPFPELSLSVDQSGLDKPMGISKSTLDVQMLPGKTLYRYCVVAVHKEKLSTHRDSVETEAAGPGVSVEASLQASTKQKDRRPAMEDPAGGAGCQFFYFQNQPHCQRLVPSVTNLKPWFTAILSVLFHV